MNFAGTKLAFGAIFSLGLGIVLPWMLPPSGGPSPSIVPWLFSISCIGVLGCLLFRASALRTTPLLLLSVGIVVGLRGQNALALAAIASVAALSVVVLIVVNWGKNDNRVGLFVAWCWLIAAFIGGLIGLSQYFGIERYFEPWMSQSGSGEVYGNLRQRNQFASLNNIGLVALLYVASYAAAMKRRRIVTTAGFMLVAMVLAISLNASASRTGLLQLVFLSATVLAWGGWHRPNVRILLIVVWASYGFATEILPILSGFDPASFGVLGRLQEPGPDCASRWTLWRNVLQLISQRPWLGWGWGELDYAHFTNLYEGPRFCEILDNAHNLPLHLAVELGIPAALVICVGSGWFIVHARPWAETDSERQMAWLVLAIILTHSMLEYPLWYGPFQMALGLCIGLLWPYRQKLGASREKVMQGRIVVWVLTLLLFAGAIYAAWDYHRISQIYLIPKQRSEAYRDNTLEKIRASWLFRDQVNFAELTTTELTRDNAAQINALAKDVLHFSPEARVVEKLVESAMMLGHHDEAQFYLARYRVAYPNEHARWASEQATDVK